MGKKKRNWIVLIVLAAGIKIFSLFPNAVEKYYATGIYPAISQTQRIILGWIPFSVGDIFYASMILLLLYKLADMIIRLVKRKTNKQYWLGGLRTIGYVVLLVYVFFNALWGLNYNRRGVAHQLGMQVEKYSTEDLVVVMETIVDRLNALDSSAHLNRIALKEEDNVFEGALIAYDHLFRQHPEFAYSNASIKSSLFSKLGNYLGYTGYYNPFSGEAQVNTAVPVFIQPFTTCHEIGHQLGYAKENEANFAGYLSAKSSDNPAFRYSVYFDLYSYARFYLYVRDSTAANQLNERLQEGVKKDYLELRDFVTRHSNPAEKAIDKIYSEYLKANEQPGGRLSYNEVVAWLVAYYKKFGKEAI